MAGTAALMGLVRALRGAARADGPGLGERLLSVPRLVRSTWRGDYAGITRGRLAALSVALLYLLSPFDLVPEAVLPLVGLADDAVVFAWLAGALLGETEAFLSWERSRAQPGRRRDGRRPADQTNVVPGQVLR